MRTPRPSATPDRKSIEIGAAASHPPAERPAPPANPQEGEEKELWQALATLDSAFGPESTKPLRTCNLLADHYRTHQQPEPAIDMLRYLLTASADEFRDWKGKRQKLLVEIVHLFRQLERSVEGLLWL